MDITEMTEQYYAMLDSYTDKIDELQSEIARLTAENARLKDDYKNLEIKFNFFYDRLDPEGQQNPLDWKERWER